MTPRAMAAVSAPYLGDFRGQGLRKEWALSFICSSSEMVLCTSRQCRTKTHLLLRLGRTTALCYTKQTSAKLLPISRNPNVSPSFLRRWGEWRGKKKILAVMVLRQVENGAVRSTYLCRECETSTSERWKMISSQRALILKLRCCCCMLTSLTTLLRWKESLTKLRITTHFSTMSGWTPLPSPSAQAQTGRMKPEGKGNQSGEPRACTQVPRSCQSSNPTAGLKPYNPSREHTHILTISLSAEGSVSCLHFKWLKS